MLSTEGSSHNTNMGSIGSEANDSSKEETPLICGLPDDISIIFLARVPGTYHAKLKCVSKRWRKLVCGEKWRMIRKKYNLEEAWIYAFCEDGYGKGGIPKYCCYVLDLYAPTRCWKRIQDLPPCIVQRQCMKFEVLGHKAYFIGGRDFTKIEWEYLHSDTIPNIADEVHCYDEITNSWSKAAPLSTPRCNFASEVLDGKIYAAGSELNPDGKHTWEAYDPVTNIWTAKSDPRVMDRSTESIAYNGKLYATYVDHDMFFSCGAVYDPSTGIWHDVDHELLSGWDGTSVVVDGRLYTFDQVWCKLMRWEEDKKKWIHFVDLSSYLMRSGQPTHYHLVAIGKSILFIREGLRTLELDVNNVGKGWELPISHVTTFDYPTIPLICKGMTI